MTMKMIDKLKGIFKAKKSKVAAAKPDLVKEAEDYLKKKKDKEVFICEVCGKECKSRIGLHSHMRTHNE